MPLYEYRCPNGHHTELHLSIHEPTPDSIPCQCDAPAKRVFSKPMVPVLDAHRARFGRRRRPNPGDDLPRQNDWTLRGIV